MRRKKLEGCEIAKAKVLSYVGMDKHNKHGMYSLECSVCGLVFIARGYEITKKETACPICSKRTRRVSQKQAKPSLKKTESKKLKKTESKRLSEAAKAKLRETYSGPNRKKKATNKRASPNSLIPPQRKGASKLVFYDRWRAMVGRCFDPANDSYRAYGARGIRVERVWLDAYAYNEWAAAHGLRKGFDVDRIDVNGNYCPENCRVIPRQKNRPERLHYEAISYEGFTVRQIMEMSKAEFEDLAPSERVIRDRLRKGEHPFSAMGPIRGARTGKSARTE